MEYENQKRYFLTVSFQELSILLHLLEPLKQTFNEVLSQNNFCKLYFDVDIYIEKSLNLNITESLFILQNLFHCIIFNCTNHAVVSKLKVEFNYSTIASTIQLLAFHYQCFPKHFTKGFSSVVSSNLMLILIND